MKQRFIDIIHVMDAAKVAGNMGIQSENAFDCVASEAGVESMFQLVNENVSKRRKR